MSAARVALYWAPETDDPLHALGSRWLGRDAETGASLDQPDVPGLDLREITRDARRYGLHATLKAPFRPSGSWSALREDAAALAAGTAPFDLPPLSVRSLGGFLALTEDAPCPPLRAFADACVTRLDRHRAPMGEGERARRRPERLDEAERAHLDAWGYPHVLDLWQFHVTLSRRLSPEEEDVLRPGAEAWVGQAASRPRRVRSFCLFAQAGPDEPFLIAERLPLGD